MKRTYLLLSITVICILVISQFAYSAPGFVMTGYACSTWQVGQRVDLRGGSEIRHGSGLGYAVHTIVPEDHWQVDIIDGPRHADGYTWWGISRRNLDGGGTGWVYIEQAGLDVCGNSPPPSTAGQLTLVDDLRMQSDGSGQWPPRVGDKVIAHIKIQNTGGQALTLNNVGVRGRRNGGEFWDIGWWPVTLQPGEVWELNPNNERRLQDGNYSFRISYQVGSDWREIGNEINFTAQSAPSSPAGFSFCAEEGNYCSFSGTGDVAYGAQGSFYYAYGVSGGIHCSNGSFGDPINGVHKACYFRQTSSPPSVSSPGLSSPGDGTSWPQSTAIVLQWSASSNAAQYRVELWGEPYTTMTPCDWQSGTSCTIGQMWPGTRYWKVKARDNNGRESDWSSTWSFNIQEIQPPQEPPSQPPSNPEQPSNPQSPSNPQQPSNPQPPSNSNPPASNTDPLQADACPGVVKYHISGYTTPPEGRYIYVPPGIDVLRLRQSPSTETCSYGWLTPQHYYSVVQERNDGWIQIDTNIGQGWIVGQYVQLGTNQPQAEPPAQAPQSVPQELPAPDFNPAPEANPSAQISPPVSDGGSVVHQDYDGTSPRIYPAFTPTEGHCNDSKDTDFLVTFSLNNQPEWNNYDILKVYVGSDSWWLNAVLWVKRRAAIVITGSPPTHSITLCISNASFLNHSFISQADAATTYIWLDNK